MLLDQRTGVLVEAQARPHDRHAQRSVGRIRQRDRQAETIQQLRPQFALLRVHGADQHEARGMLARDAVPLDGVDATGGHIEQGIDQCIGQQVDFVDIQHAMVGPREQARCQAQPAVAQHVFHAQRAHELLDGGRQRQRDEGRGQCSRRRRHQGRERTRSGRLGRAARAADQHPADAGVDGGQQQGTLQQRLADQRAEGKGRTRGCLDLQAGIRFNKMRCHQSGPSPCSSSRRSSASRWCSMRSRWSPGSDHRPRRIASSSRSPMPRSASGLCCWRNSRVVSSCT